MFSDDLWNLVYVKRGYNSSKSNRIVGESKIIKLEETYVQCMLEKPYLQFQ